MKEKNKSGMPVRQESCENPRLEVFRDNEIKANRLISGYMFVCTFVIIVCWLLNAAGVLAIDSSFLLRVFPVSIAGLAIPAAICRIFRGERKWNKYLLLVSIMVVQAFLDSMLTFNVTLLILLPVVFSCRYYSRRLTLCVSILTTLLFAASAWVGAVVNLQTPDLNFANADTSVYLREVMVLSFLPRWIVFAVLSAFCCIIAECGRKMVLRQYEITQKTSRVEAELEMAAGIQQRALPDINALPDNTFRFFDLAAEMVPAKEVGGDFYDFFYPDPEHLALVIADVADKGIAASLFMMMSKTMLNSGAAASLSPGTVLKEANRQLYHNSPKGMFVTVWLGILDLRNGELTAANAGHEYPVLKRKNGGFELYKDPHGFVLGGLPKAKFPEYSVKMEEGDILFVYSDGIPEANNGNEEFGTSRMLAALNRCGDCSMRELIGEVKADVSGFTDGAQQFDDMTMLAFQMGKAKADTGLWTYPELSRMDTVQEYIGNAVNSKNLAPIQNQKIGVAVDEIFSNICKYSQATQVFVLCETEDDCVRITFRDNGNPFDPLSKRKAAEPADPKTRSPGGLGIMITKKLMDRLEYRYEDGMNCLSMTLSAEKLS